MKKRTKPWFLMLFVVVGLLVLPGQMGLGAAADKEETGSEKKAPLEETESVTQHPITLDGVRIAYTSTCEEIEKGMESVKAAIERL